MASKPSTRKPVLGVASFERPGNCGPQIRKLQLIPGVRAMPLADSRRNLLCDIGEKSQVLVAQRLLSPRIVELYRRELLDGFGEAVARELVDAGVVHDDRFGDDWTPKPAARRTQLPD